MDREAWHATVHGITKSQTWLSNWTDWLSFKPTVFSLSPFSFKRLFSSSSLSAIRELLSAYLKLLILLANLSTTCESSPAFPTMYSVYMLNKQGVDIQSWCTPFPVLNKSIVPCPVLTIPSCPEYRLLRRQVRWPGIPISLRIFHGLLWSTQSKTLA